MTARPSVSTSSASDKVTPKKPAVTSRIKQAVNARSAIGTMG
jgi:hypothetical protein